MKPFILIATFILFSFIGENVDAQVFRRFTRITNYPTISSSRVSHNCPKCRTPQYMIASYNRNGTHNHICPRCRTMWTH